MEKLTKTMHKKILISVVIPVYNTEKYLPKCLDSILNQSFKNIEIIVVNDGSLGACNEIVKTYIKKYGNIKLIENKNNLGLYNTRLAGIKEAKGEYIMHVDSDDYILDNSLNELANIIREDDYDIIAFNHFLEYDNKLSHCGNHNRILSDCILNDIYQYYEELLCKQLAESMHSKLIKRDLYKHIKEIEQNITFQEDYLAIVSLLFYCKSVRFIPKEYYVYCQIGNSSTKFYNKNFGQKIKTLEDLSFVNENAIKFFKEKNIYSHYKNIIKQRENEYYNWIYNDIISNLKDNEKKIIEDLILKAFPLISPNLKILNRINNNKNGGCYISIVIPVHNTEKYLKRCLDSIVNQSFKYMEIIIVDDCSSGNCYEIFEEYKNNNNMNINYIKNEENLGSAWSRLNGLSYAKGEYVHFVDSDDWVAPNCYQKISEYLGKEYDCLHFNGIYSFEDGTTKEAYFQIAKNTILNGKRKAFNDMFIGDERRRTVWSRVFRRKCVLKGVYAMPKVNLSVADDWILNLFSLFFVEKYRSVSDIFYYYFQDNPDAMTAVVENKSKSAISIDKSDNTLRQTYISYNSVVNFLKQNKVWENYRVLWQLYITRDLKYQFINQYSNLENYLLNLYKENKEEYIKESVKLFQYSYIKTSTLLQFIESNLYDSNGGNINTFFDSVLKSRSKNNIFSYLFSINKDINRTVIYFLGFRITIKKQIKL